MLCDDLRRLGVEGQAEQHLRVPAYTGGCAVRARDAHLYGYNILALSRTCFFDHLGASYTSTSQPSRHVITSNAHLRNSANRAATQHYQCPRIRNLLHPWPETVLLYLPFLQLLVLLLVVRSVSCFLVRFILLVSADEAQEDVISERSCYCERVEEIRAVEKREE